LNLRRLERTYLCGQKEHMLQGCAVLNDVWCCSETDIRFSLVMHYLASLAVACRYLRCWFAMYHCVAAPVLRFVVCDAGFMILKWRAVFGRLPKSVRNSISSILLTNCGHEMFAHTSCVGKLFVLFINPPATSFL